MMTVILLVMLVLVVVHNVWLVHKNNILKGMFAALLQESSDKDVKLHEAYERIVQMADWMNTHQKEMQRLLSMLSDLVERQTKSNGADSPESVEYAERMRSMCEALKGKAHEEGDEE